MKKRMMIVVLSLLLGLSGCEDDCSDTSDELILVFTFGIQTENGEDLFSLLNPDGTKVYPITEMSFYGIDRNGNKFNEFSPPLIAAEGIHATEIISTSPKSFDIDTTYYHLKLNEVDTDTLGLLFKSSGNHCVPYLLDRFFYNGEEFFPNSTNYTPHLIFIKK